MTDYTDLKRRLRDSIVRMASMCKEHRGPRMTIPVKSMDDDVVIVSALEDAMEAIDRLEEQYRRIEESHIGLERELAEARKDSERLRAEILNDSEMDNDTINYVLGIIDSYAAREDTPR